MGPWKPTILLPAVALGVLVASCSGRSAGDGQIPGTPTDSSVAPAPTSNTIVVSSPTISAVTPTVASSKTPVDCAFASSRADFGMVADAVGRQDVETLCAFVTLSSVDCAEGSPLQSVHTLCEASGTDVVEGFWLGEVEVVLVLKVSIPLVLENLLARGLKLHAVVRRQQMSAGLFPLGDTAVVFSGTDGRGQEIRDTINLSDGRIVSIQFTNSDFPEDKLRDSSDPDVILAAE